MQSIVCHAFLLRKETEAQASASINEYTLGAVVAKLTAGRNLFTRTELRT